MEHEARIYEYSSSVNPDMTSIPVRVMSADLHKLGQTHVSLLDLSTELNIHGPATSPNLLASFLHIKMGDFLITSAVATSSCFFVIRGIGKTIFDKTSIFNWTEGDLFVLPGAGEFKHIAESDSVIYYVHDAPLLKYLGCSPIEFKFQATLHRGEIMRKYVEVISGEKNIHRNRLGALLGTASTEKTTKTLTHTLWGLLNMTPKQSSQAPHRHNSIAIDLCVFALCEGCYTLMGPELDEKGWVKDPLRISWKTGSIFTTPPGWWHSHHNETNEDAWVLPIQDAGLYTYQRTLNIEFSNAV